MRSHAEWAVFFEVPTVPLLPRRCARLEGGVAGGDPGFLNLAHSGPVVRVHLSDGDIGGHALVARMIAEWRPSLNSCVEVTVMLANPALESCC